MLIIRIFFIIIIINIYNTIKRLTWCNNNINNIINIDGVSNAIPISNNTTNEIIENVAYFHSRQLLAADIFTTESENTITISPDDPRSVFAIDMDGDGDIDVIVGSNRDDTVAWYENNGSESFTEHVITTNADAARSVFAIDLDGDGDIDVIVGSNRDDTVAWYENNGSESFTEHEITTNADQVR